MQNALKGVSSLNSKVTSSTKECRAHQTPSLMLSSIIIVIFLLIYAR